MESSIESALALLENWRANAARVHFSFSNKWEGWSLDFIGSIDTLGTEEGSVRFEVGSMVVKFETGRFDRISVLNPMEEVEGISGPSAEGVEKVRYVSDKIILITLKNQNGEAGHSYLGISKIVEDIASV